MLKFILIFLVLSFNISCSKDSVKKSVINEKSLEKVCDFIKTLKAEIKKSRKGETRKSSQKASEGN